MTDKKVLITKISKQGMNRTVGSAFGFGSYTIGGTMIEIEVDPPIDLTTEEGQEAYKKLKQTLSKMCLTALKEDVELARKEYKELDASITHREKHVNNALTTEEE